MAATPTTAVKIKQLTAAVCSVAEELQAFLTGITESSSSRHKDLGRLKHILQNLTAISRKLGVHASESLSLSGDGSQVLGQFSGGRGPSDTLFTFTVPMAGLYPLRLIWENGGGDANSEWFTVDSLGNKILVNDPSSTVKAWTSRTVANPATHINASLSGSTLTLSWTGEGELEYSYDLGAPVVPIVPNNGGAIISRWNKASNQSNPQTINVTAPGAGQTFYRIRSF